MPKAVEMMPQQLRRHIKQLDPNTPKHKELEHSLREGVGYGKAWYRHQKEHWLGWLGEYSGSGAYGRKTGKERSAEFAYNHIQCAPMLFWLAEALGIEERFLDEAFAAVVAAPKKNASQCAAFRRIVPWSMIETSLLARKQPGFLSYLGL